MKEIELKAKALMLEHVLEYWTFGWHGRKRSFGTCFYSSKEIKLSSFLSEHRTEEQLIQTILHEIAHALAYTRHGVAGHGPIWAGIAASIGVQEPKATRKESIPVEKFTWGLYYKDKFIRGWFRKPTATIKKLPFMYLKSAPEESKGKLEIRKI